MEINLTRHDRSVILFFSKDCPLQRELRELGLPPAEARETNGTANPDPIYGVSEEALRLWRTGEKKLSEGRFRTHLLNLSDRIKAFGKTLPKGDASAMKCKLLAGRLDDAVRKSIDNDLTFEQARVVFGYRSRTEAQRQLDQVYFRDRPLLPCAYLAHGSKDAATAGSQTIGVYRLFLLRPDGKWWLSPMRIRYVLYFDQSSKRRGPQLGFLRTKLVIWSPIARSPEHNWHYDGHAVFLSTGLQVTVATRSALARHDTFSLLTGQLRPMSDGTWAAAGQYVTTDQTSEQTVISNTAILQRLTGMTEQSEAQEDVTYMKTGAKALKARDPELKNLKQLLASLR